MQTIPPAQIKALIDLLSKETGSGVSLLHDELSQIIKHQPETLQQVIEKDFNSTVPVAFAHALQEIFWQELDQHLTHFTNELNPNLEEGLTWVTRFVNPAVHPTEIKKSIDDLAKTLRPLLTSCFTAQDILQAMGRYFFHTHSFTVLPTVHDIKEISFGRFIQKKRGSALCISALYVVCARQLGIQMELVDMAGRVLVMCKTPFETEPLFADPLTNGTILTLEECKNYIATRNLEWNDNFILPLSSQAIVRRFFGTMIFVLNKLRDERRLVHVRRYMDILNN